MSANQLIQIHCLSKQGRYRILFYIFFFGGGEDSGYHGYMARQNKVGKGSLFRFHLQTRGLKSHIILCYKLG